MSTAVAAIARADFLDRARRPAFPLTVLGALALGYIAVPPESAGYAMVKVGAFRGVYDSAYVGTMLAMIGSLWLPLFGFLVVRGALTRDRDSGVGRLLAATPLRTPAYLLGKYLGNLAVLAAMVAALALIAPVMQLLRGEDGALDPVALWLPLLLFCLPMSTVAAATAMVFDSVPLLRGGFGNIVWFFVFPAIFLAAIPRLYGETTAGFQADVAAQYPGANTEISIGLTMEENGLGRFVWSGQDLGLSVALVSLALVLVATLAAAAPTLWFPRFDPARGRITAPRPPETMPDVAPAPATFSTPGLTGTQARRGNPWGHLLAGEARILLRGASPWWWAGLAGLTVAALVVPERAIGTVLLFAWLWPVLLWSRLGTHAAEAGVEELLRCGPAARRRLPAEWGAGVLVAAVAGSGPLLRMVIAADLPGITAWLAGATLIPALALLLGSIGRGARLFQAVYLVLWYAILNNVAGVDVMGALRDDGRLTGPSPFLVLLVTAVLMAAALLVQEVRHAHR